MSLVPEFLNPNAHVNIDAVLLRITKEFKLTGVKEVVRPDRYDLDIHCDVGAQSPLYNISVWMGEFHIEKNIGLILAFRIFMLFWIRSASGDTWI
jgi:hypothetical protein